MIRHHWTKVDVLDSLNSRIAQGREVSFTGLRRDGYHGLIGAALKSFGSLRVAIESLGHSYGAVCRTRPKGHWRKKENVRRALEDLSRKLEKPIASLLAQELKDNGLGSVLQLHGDSPERLLRSLGFSDGDIRGRSKSQGYWSHRGNRIAAIREVMNAAGKTFKELSGDDFKKHGCGVVWFAEEKGWPLYKLFREAGFSGKPWELLRAGNCFIDARIRREAVRWAVARLGKDHHELTRRDFDSVGLSGLLVGYYSNSPLRALADAGFKIEFLRFHQVPSGFYQDNNRVLEIMSSVLRVTGKGRYEELVAQDFKDCGARGLLRYRSIPDLVRVAAGDRFDPARCARGSYRHTSKSGHLFKSDEERRLCDLLSERYGFQDHVHNHPYPSSRMNCDFVSRDGRVWIEYVGMLGQYPPGKGWSSIENAYRLKIRRKRRLARVHGLNLVLVKRRDLTDAMRLDRKLLPIGLSPRVGVKNGGELASKTA